jgi:integrase
MQTRSKTPKVPVTTVEPAKAEAPKKKKAPSPAPATPPAPPAPVAPAPVKRVKGPTKKTKKKPAPYRTEYSIPEILDIVRRWTTPAAIKKLSQTKSGMTKKTKDNPSKEKTIHPGIDDFYSDIHLKKHPKTTTVSPFIQYRCGKMFDKDKISLEQFTEFVNGLSKWVHNIKYGMHQLESMKGEIKDLLKVYYPIITRESTEPFVLAWKAAGLFLDKHDFATHSAYNEALIKKKATNVLHIPQEIAENFYKLFCYKKNADVIDNIICVEATMGLRIIEALNPKVSSFEIVPNTDKVEQRGTAKMKKNKYVLSTDKVVPKTPIIITSTEFMKRLADVRADTAQYKDLSNKKMAEKYRGDVNVRILEYLRQAKIPEHSELRSSHGCRRLWIAYAFATRPTSERNMTLSYFIQTSLGHEDGGSTRNYDTIVIDSDKFLEKVASAKLDSAFRATIDLKEEIKNLEHKVDDLDIPPAPAVPLAKSPNQLEIDKQRVKTKQQFKKIKELIDSGKTSYTEMQANGVSHNMYAKYKRLHT